MTRPPRTILKRGGLLSVAALLVLSMAVPDRVAAAEAATSGAAASTDPLVELYDQVSQYSAADYTASSWASFLPTRSAAATVVQRGGGDGTERASARTKLQDAADGLVMVGGLRTLVADYETRVPADYTVASWAPFAEALSTAADVAGDPSASAPEVAAAKTALMSTADDLVAADEGSFQTITNNTFWNDTNGNPIYSQGGGVFKFGDTYYWYGVHYVGAELYRANPTRRYNNDVTFVSIPVYSSRDLVNWRFENRVATRATGLGQLGGNLGNAGWIGRLGVAYNQNTGKYVLLVQMWHPTYDHGVLFLQGDSPTGNFSFAHFQTQIVNSPTTGTGDQTIFTDEDGQSYLIFSNRQGRSRAFVSRLRASDSLRVEPGVEIGRSSSGREGNAMFKLDGRYYHAASDLHGWNTSVNHVIESTTSNIQGNYTSEYVLPGTEMDYSHVTQTGFFVTVRGTRQTTVLYAGDRWANFAWNGIGYNQWVPITRTGARPQFHSVSQWQFNATTGEWRVGPDNNYVLNPNFQADRVVVSQLRGWTNFRESGPNSIVSNVEPGANGSRFALRVGAGQSYAGGVRQQVSVPAGTYRLSVFARTSGSLSAAQVTVTDASGGSRTLNVPASGGWTRRELANIPVSAGVATVTIRAASGNGYLFVDDLELVRQSTSAPPTSAPPTSAPPTSAPPTSAPPGSCTATYRVVNSWDGGFQAEVTVSNPGSSTLTGWTVRMTLPGGQSITNVWNGVNTGTSGAVTVRNAPYNGTIAGNGSTNFGYIANGNASNVPTGVTCSSP